jgi:F0F1-type ATP synthase assembly protein I
MPDEPEPTEKELEERLKKLLGDAESADSDELNEIELKIHGIEEKLTAAGQPRAETDDIDAKLRGIEERANKLRASKALPQEESRTRPSQSITSYRGLGVGITIAYALVGPLFAGYGIGWLIDRKVGGGSYQMWGTLIGLFAGFAAALVLLARADKTGPKKR